MSDISMRDRWLHLVCDTQQLLLFTNDRENESVLELTATSVVRCYQPESGSAKSSNTFYVSLSRGLVRVCGA